MSIHRTPFSLGWKLSREGALELETVAGEAAPGETATALVTFEGNPVPGASVAVNDEDIGPTDADGRISFIVPDDDELEVKAELAGMGGRLKIQLEEDDKEHRADDDDDDDGTDHGDDDDGDEDQEPM